MSRFTRLLKHTDGPASIARKCGWSGQGRIVVVLVHCCCMLVDSTEHVGDSRPLRFSVDRSGLGEIDVRAVATGTR